MKLIVLKENLKEALGCVERVVGVNTTLPILKNIKLSAQDGKISIIGTNLEIGITKTLLGKITEQGGVTIPFQTFLSIIQNCDSDKIQLIVEGNILNIITDNYNATIQGMPTDDFPLIPSISEKSIRITIKGEILQSAISDVVFAAHISEIRPELSGVLLDYQVSFLKFAATDSFRLAERSLSHSYFSANEAKACKVIIPLKTAQEIARLVPKDKSVVISIEDNQIAITVGDIEIISRLIDGKYPEYDQIIPKETEIDCVISKQNFANAIKLVSSFSGKTNDIHLSLKEGTKALVLYSSKQQVGENKYLIPCETNGKEVTDIAFHWRHLLDGIRPIITETFFFGIQDSSKPAIIRAKKEKGFDGDEYLYVIMPIKM